MGARVHRALKRKSMNGLSIGYETKEAETDPKRPGVRILKAVDLWEITPVNFPAQPRAAVDNVKSFTAAGMLPSLKEFEAFLREAGGLSKRDAKFVVNHGFAQLARSESGQDQAAAELILGLHCGPSAQLQTTRNPDHEKPPVAGHVPACPAWANDCRRTRPGRYMRAPDHSPGTDVADPRPSRLRNWQRKSGRTSKSAWMRSRPSRKTPLARRNAPRN